MNDISRSGAQPAPHSDEGLPFIGQPATGALAAIGVTRTSQLAAFSETDLLALHGVGPKAIRILRESGVVLRGD